jgi:magnesium transporter
VRADETLALAFVVNHPDDAARVLERQDPNDAAAVLAHVPPAKAAAVFNALGPSAAAACASLLSDEQLAAILEELPPEAMTSAVRRTDPQRREQLLAALSADRRTHLGDALRFPPDSAAAIADTFVLTVRDDVSVAEAQRQLKASRHAYHYAYVVARNGTLVGAIALTELLAARPAQPIASVMRSDLVRVDAFTDLATVAMHPAWHHLDALPVVDPTGRLIGAIRHRTVRQLQLNDGPPVVETIMHLSEMYWAGLSGILTSLTPTPRGGLEDGHHVS